MCDSTAAVAPRGLDHLCIEIARAEMAAVPGGKLAEEIGRTPVAVPVPRLPQRSRLDHALPALLEQGVKRVVALSHLVPVQIEPALDLQKAQHTEAISAISSRTAPSCAVSLSA